MKPSLQLSIGHQLNLTPQLQQAIRLLHLSTLDLQQEVQQALDNNPLLEADKPEENPEQINQSEKKPEENQQDSIPDELAVDTAWEDIYQSSSSSSAVLPEDNNNFENLYCTTVNLQDHLRWQLDLTPMSSSDRQIGLTIIDGVDDSGFLTVTIDDIFAAVNIDRDEENKLEQSEILAVLHLIQRFDPIGVASSDLKECLTIQLQQLPRNTPYIREAESIVHEHLDWLGNHNYAQLMRHFKISEQQLQGALKLIQTLNPRPGDVIPKNDSSYITPDVVVKQVGERWQVELNPDALPKVRINQSYANLISRHNKAEDNRYLKSHLQEARWFIKSLQSRHDTLLKVASCIIKKQMAFLERGEEGMKPLILNDIANELELHESTISRVTTQKFIHTPRGVFELKYFFSSHVSTSSGGECSSTAIQAVIKKIIAEENPKKPLSDNKIAHILQDQGINIARRTVAKYREACNIAASNLRKRL